MSMNIRNLLFVRISPLSLSNIILWVLGIIASCVVILGVLLLLKVVSPAVDQELGIVTGHALRSIQEYSQDGRLVRDIVESRYKNPQWCAYHTEFLGDTYVRCTALESDGTVVTMQWFVKSKPSWSGGLSLQNVVMTAINEDALSIAPNLRQKGRPIYRSPDIAY
jgi:hypothetical protein